jgi:hypothetical protein
MSSGQKQDVIFTKVIYNPGSMSDDELMPESELHLDEGIKIIQVGQDDTLAPEKGFILNSLILLKLEIKSKKKNLINYL